MAPVATWVASWLITTWAPRSLSLPKTSGFTNTRTGAPGASEPSAVVVTAAMLSYWPGCACSAASSSSRESGTSTSKGPCQWGSTRRTWRTARATSPG